MNYQVHSSPSHVIAAAVVTFVLAIAQRLIPVLTAVYRYSRSCCTAVAVAMNKYVPVIRVTISIAGLGSGRHVWDRKTEIKTRFPFIVQKPASSAIGSDRSFLDAACARKNEKTCFSHTALHRCHDLAPQGTDNDKS